MDKLGSTSLFRLNVLYMTQQSTLLQAVFECLVEFRDFNLSDRSPHTSANACKGANRQQLMPIITPQRPQLSAGLKHRHNIGPQQVQHHIWLCGPVKQLQAENATSVDSSIHAKPLLTYYSLNNNPCTPWATAGKRCLCTLNPHRPCTSGEVSAGKTFSGRIVPWPKLCLPILVRP